MSCYPLSCKSLSIMKTSEKLRVQLCFHFLKLIENEYESCSIQEKEIYNFAVEYANKFHRTDVLKLTIKK